MHCISAQLATIMTIIMMTSAYATDTLTGQVTHVRDGDTIVVSGQPIRLQGLHAPELADPGGPEAARFMRTLVGGRIVTCTLTGERSYDRMIGVCSIDHHDIAAALVRAGLGRDCPRFSGGRYAEDEQPEAQRMPLPGYCVSR